MIPLHTELIHNAQPWWSSWSSDKHSLSWTPPPVLLMRNPMFAADTSRSETELWHDIYSSLSQFLCRTDANLPHCCQLLCCAWANTILPAAAAEGEDPSPEPRAVLASASWIPQHTISTSGFRSTALIHAGWAQRLFLKYRYRGSLSPCFNSPQVTLQEESHRSDYLGNSAFMLLIQYPLSKQKNSSDLFFENIKHKLWQFIFQTL